MRNPFVKLPLSDARLLIADIDDASSVRAMGAALRRLEAAVAAAEKLADRKRARPSPMAHPKPDPKDARAKKALDREEHRERMREIRRALARRSRSIGDWLGEVPCERCRAAIMADPHHLFGRGKGRPLESERNCVGLCRRCREWMQNPPAPEASVENWDWAGRHLEALGFGEEAAIAWAKAAKYRARIEIAAACKAIQDSGRGAP